MTVGHRSALVTGITGQDGSYLADLLLSKGYRVVGAVRDLNAAHRMQPTLRDNVRWVKWDMHDETRMRRVLEDSTPDEFYNLAAFSSGSGMYDDPVDIGEVNGLAVARMLEAIRVVNPAIRFCQASSREVFGDTPPVSPQDEATPPMPRSPYGAAKLYADAIVRVYRRHFGLHASSAIQFNHESPRRSLSFVTRKISHAAARIKLGLAQEVELGNLDVRRDWGYAGDFVRALWLMQQQPQADDYVLATGKAHTVREFCEVAFEYLGLDYQRHVSLSADAFRPAEPVLLVGDATKARRILGWEPEVDFVQMVHMMVDADVQLLSSR